MNEKVGGSCLRSPFITEKMAIPADMVQARFGESFELDGDQVVAYDTQGNKIFSRSNPGEVANFDEALEILIDSYPYKDHILKGSGASGSGAKGGQGGGNSQTSISRTQFESLPPAKQMEQIKSGVTITD